MTLFVASDSNIFVSTAGIYGVYDNRTLAQLDGFYAETPFIMMNDIEILMYAIGASFPGNFHIIPKPRNHSDKTIVLSRYLLKKANPGADEEGDTNRPTLMPSFVTPNSSPSGKGVPLDYSSSLYSLPKQEYPYPTDDYHLHAFPSHKTALGKRLGMPRENS